MQGLSDLVMNGAGAIGGAVAGLIVAFSSYAVLCAVAAVPVLALALLVGAWGRRASAGPEVSQEFDSQPH